jgi:salicylate hydroxylase
LPPDPPSEDKSPLLIAGGGIGGLTAAFSLARAGFPVEVFEQAKDVSEIGAGLQLSPNAMRVLDGLDLLPSLEEIVGRPEALRIYSAISGKRLARMPLGTAAKKRWGEPYYVAHRSDLQRVLFENCSINRNIKLHFNAQVQGFERRGGLSVAYTQDGEAKSKSGRGLIGADGLWSKVRAQFLNDGPPRFSGYVAYRAMIAVEALPPKLFGTSSNLWLGPDLHVVHYPLRGHAMINIIAIVREDSEDKGWGNEAEPDHLLKAAESCARLLKDLLRAPRSWTRFALYDRPPSEKPWPHGAVTLLGDAAHPMLPFLAQGAAQAIEDVAILTECMLENENIFDAFTAYRELRAPHIAALTREAEKNASIFHMQGFKAKSRDFVLRLMSGERLMQKYDWVYSGP